MRDEPAAGQDYSGLRQRMVAEQIEARGIKDERVLAAMREVPRERFVDADQRVCAFEDRALPIEAGQTVSQPYMVAAMTEALTVGPTHRVLEIGTGSGYQTAILARLAAEVYTIERLEALSRRAQALLGALDAENVRYHVGDGTLGWPEAAPFDRILVTAGAPDVPRPLVDQLIDGGRLVVPVGRSGTQTLTIVTRLGGRTSERLLMGCRFVPLIGEAGWAEGAAPSSPE
ncbi:MAG: protein-L-isoaspartate(D-aspartate) O-methyltransferase [Phycisphaerae bacterium]|nr:protein-L-isoaspartate(D-aspartate) O-methyltransferase [Phycisphaerae bacterium]